MHATANWVKVDYQSTTLLKYYAEHHRSLFLVKIDRGYGAGVEYDVMYGKHIAFRMRHVPSLVRPKILESARIYGSSETITQAAE